MFYTVLCCNMICIRTHQIIIMTLISPFILSAIYYPRAYHHHVMVGQGLFFPFMIGSRNSKVNCKAFLNFIVNFKWWSSGRLLNPAQLRRIWFTLRNFFSVIIFSRRKGGQTATWLHFSIYLLFCNPMACCWFSKRAIKKCVRSTLVYISQASNANQWHHIKQAYQQFLRKVVLYNIP